MGLEVPDWAAKTFLVLTGESWPEADEDGLRRLSGAWETFASRLDSAEHDIASAGHAVRSSWLGQGSDAFGSTMDRLTGSDALPQIRSGSRKLGFYAESSAVNVEYTKYSIIGQLVILAIEIASLVPYLFFPPTAPAAAGMIAALKALGQWIARNLFRRLLYSLMWNLVTQVGLDAIIQGIQMGKDRKEWNTKATVAAFTSGVIGTILGEAIGKIGTKVLGAKLMDTFLAHMVRGGFHEWATEAITNVIFNNPRPPTAFSATAGAAEGVIDAFGRRSRGTFARGLPGGVDIGPIEIPGLVDGDLTLEGTFTNGGSFDGVARINGTITPADGSAPMRGTFLGQLTANRGSLMAADPASSRFIGMRMDPATSFGQLKTTGTLAADFVFNGQFSPSAVPPATSPQIPATSTDSAGPLKVELDGSLNPDSASVTSQGTTLVGSDTASIPSGTIAPANAIGAPSNGSGPTNTTTAGPATAPSATPGRAANNTGETGPAQWSRIPELVGQNLTPEDLAHLWHRYPVLQELPVTEVAQMLSAHVLTNPLITDYLPSHYPGGLLGGSEQPAPPGNGNPPATSPPPPVATSTVPAQQVIPSPPHETTSPAHGVTSPAQSVTPSVVGEQPSQTATTANVATSQSPAQPPPASQPPPATQPLSPSSSQSLEAPAPQRLQAPMPHDTIPSQSDTTDPPAPHDTTEPQRNTATPPLLLDDAAESPPDATGASPVPHGTTESQPNATDAPPVPHGNTQSPPDATGASPVPHGNTQSPPSATAESPASPSHVTPESGQQSQVDPNSAHPAPLVFAPLADAKRSSQEAYKKAIDQRRNARANAEGGLAFLRYLAEDQPQLPPSNAEYQARLEQLRKLDVTDPAQLADLAFWQKMAETIQPAPDSRARAEARQQVEKWIQTLGLQPDHALADHAATIAYAQDIRQAVNEASVAANTARQAVLDSRQEQSSIRSLLVYLPRRERILSTIASVRTLVDASRSVVASTSSRVDTATEHERQAHQNSLERQLSQGPPPDDVRSAEDARIKAWQKSIGEHFDVPSQNDNGKGKDQAIQWYRVVPRHPQGSPVDAYDVSDSGWLRLRNGQTIPPGGWIRANNSLVHPQAQAVLQLDTGKITRADAAPASAQATNVADFTVTADILGLHISQDRNGPSEFLALEVRPHQGETTAVPAWSRPTTDAERIMVQEAGRNTERHTYTNKATDSAAAEAYTHHVFQHVLYDNAEQRAFNRQTPEVGDRIQRVLDPFTTPEVRNEIASEFARAERVAEYVATNREQIEQQADRESEHIKDARHRDRMTAINELRHLADWWSDAKHEAVPEAEAESIVDELRESGQSEDSRRELIDRFVTSRAAIDLATSVQAIHKAAETAGNEAARQTRRETAERAAEWRLRHQSGLTEFFGDRSRLLPPGFGEVDTVTGQRRFALGHHGRLLWAGDSSLSSEEAVARTVVQALPPNTTEELRKAVHDRVVEILTRYDPRIFVQSMLEGGTPITVTVAGTRYRVVAKLSLGDLIQAEYVPLAQAERTPPGEEWHVLVNADHELQSFARRSVSNNRTMTLSVTSPSWKFFQDRLEVTAGGGINASSGTTYGQGFDEVSATKRYLDVSGVPAYFDFGDASLSTEVTVVGSGGPVSTGSVERTIRAEFPRELAPLRTDGAHGIQPSSPQVLGDQLGVNPSSLHDDISEARSRADKGEPITAEQRRLVDLHGVLSYVFNLPESAPGLGGLREQIRQIVDAGPDPLTDDAVREIDWWVSEPAFLRMYGDITGSGAPSPLIHSGEHGFHVTLRATVLNVQAVSSDPVPLKEESQRFASDHNDVTDSGGVGVDAKAKAKGALGDSKADNGFSGSLEAEFNVSAGHNAARSLQPNSGSGEVRGLVYNTDSVRYRMVTHIGADVSADIPGVPSTTRASDVIETYVRVPVEQRSRFEAMLRHILNNDGATPHQAYESTIPSDRLVGEQQQDTADPQPDTSGLDPSTANTEQDTSNPQQSTSGPEQSTSNSEQSTSGPQQVTSNSEQSTSNPRQDTADPEESVTRYPPASITSGRSMGFTAVERLTGADNVLPTTLRLLEGLESTMVGPKPRDPMAQTALERQLGAKLTREALINAGTQLFQPSGVPFSTTLPAKGGVEHVTVRVTAERQRDPSDSGRVAKTKLELMPAGFAGLSGSDNLSGTTSAGIKLGGDFQHNKSKRGLGLGFKVGGLWTRNHGTNVSSSGFQLQAMLYDGPARTFDYNLTYSVSVTVKMKRRLLHYPLAWAKVAGALLTGRPRPTLSTTQAETHRFPGSTKFVLPEALAPKEEPTPDEIRDTGAVEVFTTDRLDDVRQMLAGEQGHAPIDADDVLTELIGAPDLARHIQAILDRLGISAPEAEQLTMWSTDQTQLEGMHIRGPSQQQPALVLRGTLTDQHVNVLLESFPVNLREAGEPISFMKMDVAEGGGGVSHFKGQKRAATLALTLGPNATFGQYSGSLPTSANWGKATETGKGKGLGPQTGRLTQLPKDYRRNVADAIWRISVTSREKNMAGSHGHSFDHVFVRVSNGIEFLRPITPALPPPQLTDPTSSHLTDPTPTQHADPTPTQPAESTPIEHAEPAPTQPAESAPAEQTTTPTTFPEHLAQIPVTAASERLLSPPSTKDPTGSKNVMLDVVTKLLGMKAKTYLKRKWTIEGMTDVPPARLTGILNPGSATALLDVLLGPGVILHTTRSFPLMHERVIITLRAERDLQSYAFSEEIDGANVARYYFRHNTTTTSTTKTRFQDVGTGIGPTQGLLKQLLKSISESLGVKSTSSSSKGHALTITDATRDTLFIPGLQGRYHGNMMLIGEITKVRAPSRLLNLLTLNLAKWTSRLYYKDQEPGRASDVFTERLLIPKSLTLPDIEPSPDPTATVEDWPALDPPASRPLPATPQDLLDRRIINLGFDPAKLKVLSDMVLSHLSDARLPVNLLAAPGTRSRDALQHMFSFPMFTRELEFMLGPDGLESPILVSDGGPLTDNHGTVRIRVKLINPRKLEYIKGWLEWSNYGFTEHKQDVGGSQGVGVDASVGVDLAGVPVTGGLSFGQTTSQTNSGVLKSMSPTTGYLRQVPWLRVSADAIVYVTVDARNKRGALAYGGDTAVMAFRVPDALELAFGPEASLSHNLLHPHGMPTPGGYYMPSREAVTDPSSTKAVQQQAEELHATFSFPPVAEATVLHVTTQLDDTGAVRFDVNGNLLTTAEFHDEVLQHLELDGTTIVLVGSNGSTAAAELARLTDKSVVAAPGPVHTTPDGHVLAATPDTSSFGQPFLVSSQQWLHVTPDGRSEQSQTFELVESLRQWGLGVPELAKPVLPPKAPVLWGSPAADSGPATASARDKSAVEPESPTPPRAEGTTVQSRPPSTQGSIDSVLSPPPAETAQHRPSAPPTPDLPPKPDEPTTPGRESDSDDPVRPPAQAAAPESPTPPPAVQSRPRSTQGSIAELPIQPPAATPQHIRSAPPTPNLLTTPVRDNGVAYLDLAGLPSAPAPASQSQTPPPAEQTTVQSRPPSTQGSIASVLSPPPAKQTPTDHPAPPTSSPPTTPADDDDTGAGPLAPPPQQTTAQSRPQESTADLSQPPAGQPPAETAQHSPSAPPTPDLPPKPDEPTTPDRNSDSDHLVRPTTPAAELQPQTPPPPPPTEKTTVQSRPPSTQGSIDSVLSPPPAEQAPTDHPAPPTSSPPTTPPDDDDSENATLQDILEPSQRQSQ